MMSQLPTPLITTPPLQRQQQRIVRLLPISISIRPQSEQQPAAQEWDAESTAKYYSEQGYRDAYAEAAQEQYYQDGEWRTAAEDGAASATAGGDVFQQPAH